VYAGKDSLSGREIRFRKTRKTEVEAQIELGKLLELARAGRQPDSDVTVAELLDAYVPVAGWDVPFCGGVERVVERIAWKSPGFGCSNGTFVCHRCR
jgi:hypothetical protein